ncbi:MULTISPECIES: hypothetical protein [unclassified Nostoc]|uniref:hypothetical protein n=2 Tax=Nostoc TaxID=1177 RepID=UPI0025AAAF0D|nr:MULTISPECIES: hypothetical protein [unclassified Nostoc]MDM9580881.1 hypothetical protein [Nostoc sp. GT001]MDZ7944315.1 hypothetical protein [Nostoc sp. EfeVER01]
MLNIIVVNSMDLKFIKKKIYTFVKIISTVLITSAIGLESWNIYAVITNINVPSSLNLIFWIERFAMMSHFVESIIAAFYAHSRQKMPIKYATYTFFVGTIGLLELFGQPDDY